MLKKFNKLSVTFLLVFFSFSSQASTGQDWFDAPLKECFEAIEEGKFIDKFRTKVLLVVPVEYNFGSKELQKKYAKRRHVKECGVKSLNFFHDDREYSLNRVMKSHKSGGATYNCPRLNAKSYAFCEYAKAKNVKGVRPTTKR
ncbi:hypothetical protein N9345_04860 [Candidatus Thioglobus sp.]|nr:hypothetical protein [Candidatus Thioglobus sp.]MDB3893492.1 hypothetical protein [Candidatus Thioglobus sp.]MDB9828971.1 hypothetical protein [Candidatus Thioglobus sp.]